MSGACLMAMLLVTSMPAPQTDHATPPASVKTPAPAPAEPEGVPRRRRSWLFDLSMAGVGAGNASDLTLTLFALNRGRTEANPVLGSMARHPAALVATKAAMTVGTMSALVKLHDHHPKLATAIATGTAVLMVSVSVHNASVIHRTPR